MGDAIGGEGVGQVGAKPATPTISLLLDTRGPIAEVLAECPKFNAVTVQLLELAWRARGVTCPQCLTEMPITERVLDTLRNHAIEARMTIDRLMRRPHEPANECRNNRRSSHRRARIYPPRNRRPGVDRPGGADRPTTGGGVKKALPTIFPKQPDFAGSEVAQMLGRADRRYVARWQRGVLAAVRERRGSGRPFAASPLRPR